MASAGSLGATKAALAVRSAVVKKPFRTVAQLLLPVAMAFVMLHGLVGAFRWSEPVPADAGALTPVPWPAGEEPFQRALVVILDGVHPRNAFDARTCAFLAGARPQARHGVALVPYVAFTNTCMRTLFAGINFDLLAAMKNFRPDRLGEDNLFRAVRAAGGSCAVVTDDVLWGQLFGGDIDKIVFCPPPRRSLPETGDLLVGERLPAVWRDTRFRLVVGHFAGLDLMGHRITTVRPAYKRHLAVVEAFVRELAADLRVGELLCVLSDHGSDRRGGHAGGEPEGRESFFLWMAKGGRLRVGDAGTISQMDVCPTLAAALGIAIPASSEGKVQAEWFDISAEAHAAMERNNLDQLRAGPARRVGEAATIDDPRALMARADELGAARLRGVSLLYLVVGCVAALLAMVWIGRCLPGAKPESVRSLSVALALALGASAGWVFLVMPLLHTDLSEGLSPWWVRGSFLIAFAGVVFLASPWGAALLVRAGLGQPGLACLLPVLVLLGIVPLTLRTGFYQLVVLGLAAMATVYGALDWRRGDRRAAATRWAAAVLLAGFVALRVGWIEGQGMDVRLVPDAIGLGLGPWLAVGLAVAVMVASGTTWRSGEWGAAAYGAVAFLLQRLAPQSEIAFWCLVGGATVLLGIAWWRSLPSATIVIGSLLGLYRFLTTDVEIVLLCLLLLAVTALLRGVSVANWRFDRVALAVPLAVAVFVYALYALDEPLTFARINVLIGDLVGVGGREVLATILLTALKYAFPLWLLMAIVHRESPRLAFPLWALCGWTFVLRLAGSVVVVSHHPRNFGEVTRIIGESIFVTSLTLMLAAAAILTSVAPQNWVDGVEQQAT